MKSYLKNKNFIPKSYIENTENSKNKGNTRGLIYLIIINLLIFPIIVERILESEKEIKPEIIEPIEEVYIESLVNWINEIDKEVIELTVKNSNGTMMVNTPEKIYSLEEKGVISIDNISKNEKGYYILEITRNNK